MNFNSYQEDTATTAIYPYDYGFVGETQVDLAVLYTALGLVSEAGEVASKIKKAIRDENGRLDTEALAMELGDVLWYVAQLASSIDYDLSHIAMLNLQKLADRRNRHVLEGSGDNR